MSETGDQSRVVVVGSTNVDLIMQVEQLPAPGETVGDATFSQASGGKGANQALAATRSGGDVSFVSVVGDDDYGRAAVKSLAAEGVDVSHMTYGSQPTGTALIFVDRHAENCIGVAPGANGLCDASCVNEASSVFEVAAVVLLQLEVPLSAVRQAIALSSNAHTVLNAAPMLALTSEDIKTLDTLVVNETELAQVVKRCVDPTELARAAGRAETCRLLQALGVTNVVVTLGEHGVFLSLENSQKLVPGFAVDAEDTTGAGDTFCGALAARLARGHEFVDAVTFAQAAAALACTQLGAQSAVPHEEAVLEFLASQ